MNGTVDPELLSFSVQVLERHGGLVERRGDYLFSLLPGPLAHLLELPEEAQLGGEGSPLLYGSPVLDRLIQLAAREVPVVYGQVETAYLKKEGFEKLLEQDLRFQEGQIHVVNRAEARTTYMLLTAHYVALSDERKEGLVRVGIHEASGALIPELEEGLSNFPLQYFEPGKTPSHFPVRLERTISSALQGARDQAESQLAEFFSSMQRRLRRDVRNTREYYEALKQEMEDRLKNPHLADGQREERTAKIQALPREMKSKIADLENKYRVQVTLTGCAAMRILVPVAQIMVLLRYRKLQRDLRVIWNPITRRLDPLACEDCQKTTRIVTPRDRGPNLFLLCPSCAAKR
jgi:hypothetical protein